MKLWAILTLSLFLSPLAFADTGGYTVEPYAPQDGLIDSNGADATVTFWDLPLWIQIAWLSILLFSYKINTTTIFFAT